MAAALEALREEVRASRAETRELRDELLLPERIAARREREKGALRYNFLSCLILTAQNGFGQDVEPFLALCRETWGEEQLWAAVKDLPHGTLRREGPARRWLPDFGREAGPFSMARTHLMYVAQAGDVARLRWLLARGAKLELKDWKGWTALHWASAEGRAETVRELLARGAAVDPADDGGHTPLLNASSEGHLEVVRELLARGAAVDTADDGGHTPLLNASSRGHLEVARELLARGAAVYSANRNGHTPLILASAFGHLEVVRELLARGAAVDIADDDDDTPLLAASGYGHLEVVRELLAGGASPGLAINGITALDRATLEGHAAIAHLLRAALADA